jgi:predicted GNAT family N-acyltransferase
VSAVHIQTGDWGQWSEPARRVRTAVFIEEQGIAAHDEWDDADAAALHAVAFAGTGEAIGTARLLVEAPGVARIGRVAVLAAWRGRHVGVALMRTLCAVAQGRGDHTVVLSAQCHAQDFYAREGFVAEGVPYDDAGIAHITMRRALATQMSVRKA